MSTIQKHPRSIEAQNMRKGLNLELFEHGLIVDTGTVISSEQVICWGRDRTVIRFRSDKSLAETEFVYFLEHGGWKVVFLGPSKERCVARSQNSHTFTFLGSILQMA